ncbi:DUF3237 family protein [Novosphingobium olei]|uniref:DUF3237 family protein n=1 Tax=Novosphingobium olei TaxID=2728851 RepID=UPI003BB1BFA6
MIELKPLFTLTADVAPTIELGECRGGIRRVVPVNGARFAGERISGSILPGGNDIQRVRDGGVVDCC